MRVGVQGDRDRRVPESLGHIVRPRGRRDAQPRIRRVGHITGLTLWEYVMDLGADDLAREEHLLSAAVEAEALLALRR